MPSMEASGLPDRCSGRCFPAKERDLPATKCEAVSGCERLPYRVPEPGTILRRESLPWDQALHPRAVGA